MTLRRALPLAIVIVFTLWGCQRQDDAGAPFGLVSSAECAFLEPALKRLAKEEGFALDIRYLTPQDMVQALGKGREFPGDAVLAPSLEWLVLGDTATAVTERTPVMFLPLALGVRQQQAEEFGLTPQGVTVADLARLANEGKLSYLLASPSQTAVGLAAYIGLAQAQTGKSIPLALADVDQTETLEALKAVFSGVARSSGSPVWVKHLFESGGYQAVFHYQHVLREANQDAARDGGEPLVIVPLVGGTPAARPTLGYVDRGQNAKWEAYAKIRALLTSDDTRRQMAARGIPAPEAAGKDAAWKRDDLAGLLTTYQERLRKPSLTVYAVEISAKMKGYAEREAKRAIRMALDSKQSSERFLQAQPKDQTYLIAYNDKVVKSWRLDSMSEDQRTQFLAQFDALPPQGKANPYNALAEAGSLLMRQDLTKMLPSVILLPYDTPTAPGKSLRDIRQYWQTLKREVPVECIQFGEISRDKLDAIAEATRGRILDGRGDLPRAVFAARGYNN